MPGRRPDCRPDRTWDRTRGRNRGSNCRLGRIQRRAADIHIQTRSPVRSTRRDGRTAADSRISRGSRRTWAHRSKESHSRLIYRRVGRHRLVPHKAIHSRAIRRTATHRRVSRNTMGRKRSPGSPFRSIERRPRWGQSKGSPRPLRSKAECARAMPGWATWRDSEREARSTARTTAMPG
jgi:hypothetical protein